MIYTNTRLPVSSHKYSVQPMHGTGLRSTTYNNKISIKGSGWNSKNVSFRPQTVSQPDSVPIVPKVSFHDTLNSRTVTEGSRRKRLYNISEEEPGEERPPCRSRDCPIGRVIRPPSRHKTPPKAVGLELPPRPCTPPDDLALDGSFDITCTSLKGLEDTHTLREERGKKEVPITVQAWGNIIETKPVKESFRGSYRQDPDLQASTMADIKHSSSSKKRPVTTAQQKHYNIPIIITYDGDLEESKKRRVYSANKTSTFSETASHRPPSSRGTRQMKNLINSEMLGLWD